jgi:hypothetical protein
LVEQLIRNQQVTSSSLVAGSIFHNQAISLQADAQLDDAFFLSSGIAGERNT